MVVVFMIRHSWGSGRSGSWPVVGQGIAELPGCRMRAVWRALRISLRAAEIHTWGCGAATVRFLSPEEEGTQLTVAHSKEVGPTYDDALSRLGHIPGPLILMLPTDLAAALRQELDSCDRLKVGWEAAADGALLSLLLQEKVA